MLVDVWIQSFPGSAAPSRRAPGQIVRQTVPDGRLFSRAEAYCARRDNRAFAFCSWTVAALHCALAEKFLARCTARSFSSPVRSQSFPGLLAMRYPEFPAGAFIAAVLVLIPLPAHWRSRSVATVSIIVWLFVMDIIYGVNTIVWDGNVFKHLLVWCDISKCQYCSPSPNIRSSGPKPLSSR